MGAINLQKVVKRFGDVEVIPPLDLEINEGEFVVFVGPSGCGKSTLLRLIAGLEDLTDGSISIAGKDISALPPGQRGLAMVFQSYALYPHMSVEENMMFPLLTAKMKHKDAQEKVRAAADVLNLSSYLDRKPGQLSGGQRQRVAIGRAIVREPSAFLFDEPLSNLDAALRVVMRLEILDLLKRLDTTMIYVTHDQVEAMTMADRIVVLRDGIVEQVGSPLELYEHPRNLFVAGFIGSPKMNLIAGEAAVEHGAATVGVRPEHLQLSIDKGLWTGEVLVSEHLGSDTFLHINSEHGVINVRAQGEVNLHSGDRVWLTPEAGTMHRFDAEGMATGREQN